MRGATAIISSTFSRGWARFKRTIYPEIKREAGRSQNQGEAEQTGENKMPKQIQFRKTQ